MQGTGQAAAPGEDARMKRSAGGANALEGDTMARTTKAPPRRKAVFTPAETGQKIEIPPQSQKRQPGIEEKMKPLPQFEAEELRGSGRLEGKIALVTGGDSGIGRAVVVAFAREGADVAIVYLDEHGDAQITREHVEKAGRACVLIAGDVGDEDFCRSAVAKTVEQFGRIDVLVNNAAEQHHREDPLDIPAAQLERTFRTNVFSYFFMTRATVPHMVRGASIVNTTSVTAYRGSDHLADYASTKGAIVAYTRSMSAALVKQGIRVNGVAPGPVWTPLIPASYPARRVSKFGRDVPMGRPAQPEEIAPCFVFLASADSSYMTGQVLHPNGGEIVNG
jgi:NAD(P)-dependent dehydrogenase (short-subunit alcohol dehydrogenase family)